MAEFRARARAAAERFRAALADVRGTQTRLLFDECITPNVDTSFGREHGFARMRSIDDFRAAVPIRTYDEMVPWIERAAAGERGVLTAEDPLCFNRTSGTGSVPKRIPVTRTYRMTHDRDRALTAWGLVDEKHPELLAHDNALVNLVRDIRPVTTTTSGGIPWLPFSIGCANHLRDELRGEPGTAAEWALVPESITDEQERKYYRLRLAIEHDVRGFFATNPSTLLVLADQLQSALPRLIRELTEGTVCGVPGRAPARERARELEALVGRRFTMKDVWPRLSVVMAWTAASCGLYLPRVLERYGEGVQVQPVLSNSSEGPLTMVSTEHLTAGPPCITDVFYELLPVGGAQTLLADELEVGGEYEMIMTQSCGLYRYAIGDVFRVASRQGNVPLIEFVGRKGVVSSFTGEKLTEAHIQQVLETLPADCGHATCFPRWGEPPFYIFIVESAQPQPALAAQLDAELCRRNEEYASKRETSRLACAEVQVVPPGTFARYRDRLATAGTAPDQVKHKLIHRDDSALPVLLASRDA
jgi:hypothetical protein